MQGNIVDEHGYLFLRAPLLLLNLIFVFAHLIGSYSGSAKDLPCSKYTPEK